MPKPFPLVLIDSRVVERHTPDLQSDLESLLGFRVELRVINPLELSNSPGLQEQLLFLSVPCLLISPEMEVLDEAQRYVSVLQVTEEGRLIFEAYNSGFYAFRDFVDVIANKRLAAFDFQPVNLRPIEELSVAQPIMRQPLELQLAQASAQKLQAPARTSSSASSSDSENYVLPAAVGLFSENPHLAPELAEVSTCCRIS